MSVLKEKYDPESCYTYTLKKGFALSQEKRLVIHSGEATVSIIRISGQLSAAGLLSGAAILFWWPIALAIMIIPMLWVIFPTTRPIAQKELDILLQSGTSHRADIPNVNWSLFLSLIYIKAQSLSGLMHFVLQRHQRLKELSGEIISESMKS